MAIETTTVTAPETTQATSQAATGTTQAGAGPNDQFLGLEPDLGFESQTTPEQDPEPAGEEGEATTEGEGEAEELAATGETETEEAATTEEGDDWLPSEQEKRFPPEVLQQYAEKRGYNWAKIKDDQTLMRMLNDKLNTDIYLRQVQEEAETGATLEEPTLEEEGAEAEAETTTADATAAAANDPRAQHYQRVDNLLTQIDTKATDELGRQLLGAMGVKTDDVYVNSLRAVVRNPQATPAQRADAQQTLDLVQGAGKIGGTLARGALDLVLTALPSVLPEFIEQIFPGTTQNYEKSVYVNASSAAWNGVRELTTKGGAKPYADLPAFGTPEFRKLAYEAERKLGLAQGQLEQMVFQGTNARNPQGIMQGATRAYRMIAQVAKGQSVTPAAVATAVETGRRQEREVGQRRAAGRALGAGTTSRNFAQEESGDPIRDALREQIAQHNQDDFPVSNITRR